MKPYVGGLPMALLLATCSNAGVGSTANQGRSPRECQAEAGAATDLASEPDWASYGDYARWNDANGCAVRVDVVGDHLGPEHCGWTSVRFLTMTWPPGDPVRDSEGRSTRAVQWVRDPHGVLAGLEQLPGELRQLHEMPEGAVDTGLRRGDEELWVDPDDGSILLVTDGKIEQWPRAVERIGCE